MILDKLLEIIFEQLYALTTNYGVSIILLSLVVTLIMLPLFWYAEKLQNKERKRKAIMQPALDKIKNIKNKQEKFYYTKEIYRINNYKPYYSLTGLIGLAIQVPFFIAVYIMLKDYTLLEGVSFGPINDLFQPDKIIEFLGITINLLPILMTLVNLVGVGIQYRYIDKSEAVQLAIISFVFLVLLYNLSAALVLYWTMTNVFAIGKNYLLSLKLEQEQKRSVNDVLKDVSLFIRQYFKDTMLILLSIFTVYLLISVINSNPILITTKNVFLRVLFTCLSCFLIFMYLIKKLKHNVDKKVTPLNTIKVSVISNITILIAVIFVFGSILWGLVMTNEVRNYSEIGLKLKVIILISGSMLSIIGITLYFSKPILLFLRKPIFPKIPNETKTDKNKLTMVITSNLLFWLCVFILIPLQIYFSVPEDFDFKPFQIFLPLLAQIIFALGVIWVVIKIAFKKKTLVATLITIISFILVINLTYPTPDWGLLKDFFFENYVVLPIPLVQSMIQITVIVLFSTLVFYLLYFKCLIQKFSKYISLLFLFISLGLVGQTVFIFLNDIKVLSVVIKKEHDISPIRLSKNKNTVIFFSDAFDGNAIPLLLKEYPELYKKLDGFTYYADAISQGSWTWNGTPGILGGHEYTPFNHLDKDGNIYQKSLKPSVDKFANDFADSFDELNFYGKHIFNNAQTFNNIKKYDLIKGDNMFLQKELRSKLFSITIFKTAPLIFKNLIYNKGGWRQFLGKNYLQLKIAYDRYKRVQALNSIKLVDGYNNCSFIFTEVTHAPFHLNKSLTWNDIPARPYWGTEGAALNSSHFVLRKISDFIEKAKEYNVYDDMQIIIVSDHGNQVIPQNLTNDKYGLSSSNDPLYNNRFKCYSALLMVKQPNSNGKLKINTNTFMSNADVPAIIQANINNNSQELFAKFRDEPRKLIHVYQINPLKEEGKLHIHIEMDGTSLDTSKWKVLRNDFK